MARLRRRQHLRYDVDRGCVQGCYCEPSADETLPCYPLRVSRFLCSLYFLLLLCNFTASPPYAPARVSSTTIQSENTYHNHHMCKICFLHQFYAQRNPLSLSYSLVGKLHPPLQIPRRIQNQNSILPFIPPPATLSLTVVGTTSFS